MNKNLNDTYTIKMIIFTLNYGLSFYTLKMFSKQNSWLTVIFSSIIGFFILKMFLEIKKTKPDQSVLAINKFVLGPKLSFIINTILSLTFILLASIILWYLIIFLKTNFFPKTSSLIIGLATIIPIFYISNKKNQVLTKTSTIFAFVVTILTIFSIIFLAPQMEVSNLKPFQEVSSKMMLKSIFCYTALTFIPTYAALANPDFKIKNLKMSMFKITILIFIIVISTYLVLGNKVATMVDFPEFFVLRKIGILSDGTRIDSLIIIGFLLGNFSILSTIILFLRDFIKVEFNSTKPKFTYFIISGIFLLALNIFKNISDAKKVILDILPLILFFIVFGINLLIFILIKFQKKLSWLD